MTVRGSLRDPSACLALWLVVHRRLVVFEHAVIRESHMCSFMERAGVGGDSEDAEDVGLMGVSTGLDWSAGFVAALSAAEDCKRHSCIIVSN